MIGKLPKISKRLAADSLLSRALLLCMIIAAVSCRSPQATDLSAEAPQGYYFDLPGLSDTPPEDEAFTPRLSLPSNIKQNSKVWLKYGLPNDNHMDRLLARNCTNVLAIFQASPKSFRATISSREPPPFPLPRCQASGDLHSSTSR